MNHSIRSRVDTQPPPEKVPLWVVVFSFVVLLIFFVLLGIGLYKVKGQQVTVGNAAPEFSVTSFDGVTYNKDSVAGKIVVIHFWASWCQPCEAEALLVENAWRQFDERADVIFLGISQAESMNESIKFLQDNQITYPNGSDSQAEIADSFQIRGVPETIILNKDGKIAYIQIGPFLSTDALVDIVNHIE